MVMLSTLLLSFAIGYASRPCPSGFEMFEVGQSVLMDGIFIKAQQGRTFVITISSDKYEVYPRRDKAVLVRKIK
jgi:hypothetical protein